MASSSLWRENIAALHFVSSDEALSRHTTMKVGGPAALWAQPANEEELSEILRRVWRYEAPFFVVGAGLAIQANAHLKPSARSSLAACLNVTRLKNGSRLAPVPAAPEHRTAYTTR